MRGGVPVFSRPCGSFSSFSRADKAARRRIAGPAGAVVLQADMDAAVEEGAGGQHHGPRSEANAHLRDGADDAVALEHQVVHRLLEQPQVRLVLQAAPDRRLVQHAVGLGARGAHGRALAAIEDAELDAGLVGGERPSRRPARRFP